jgi:hypothetical protein
MYLTLKTTHSTIIMKLLKHKVYSHLENNNNKKYKDAQI